MTTLSMLKNVKRLFPELKQLPKAKLQVVEDALVYAAGLGPDEGLISEEENKQLLKKLGLKGGINPANSLKAYRLRQNLTQQELARRANIPQSNISAMEKGTRPIGLKSAKKLGLILHCNYKKLV
ncbi:MAG: helix-turn-helix transcriptional regulator [Deltaproteobacteria bacterium]|nr:helix-turn-helix transcriptional regulator [Deltaproteobacteria bacterium]